MQRVRKHHFVPECYLKKFILNEHLYSLDIKKLKAGFTERVRRSSPAQICYLLDYYLIRQDNAVTSFSLKETDEMYIESSLLKSLEDDYAALLENLMNGKILVNDAVKRSDFIIHLKLRNPYYFEKEISANAIAWIDETMRNIYKQNKDNPRFKSIPDELQTSIHESIKQINLTNPLLAKDLQLYILKQRDIKNGDVNKQTREAIVNCEWRLLKAPRGMHFITSDNPGYAKDNDGLLYNTKFKDGFSFFLPLTFEYCLAFSNSLKDDCLTTDEEFKPIKTQNIQPFSVIDINNSSMQKINHLLIACEENYLNLIGQLNKPR